MKYDRPVHELMADCARELHEPFTRESVIEWFRRHYPDVKTSTVAAHMAGLTVGRNPDTYPNLTRRPPVFERVGRGLYARAGSTAAKEAGRTPPTAATADVAQRPTRDRARTAAVDADVLLIGCVKSKRTTAAPARDLYTSTLWARRRRYAEESGVPWFVVSSRWGLVAPDEVIAPYDVYLGDMPSRYRHGWAGFVVAQLELEVPLAGAVVEIHAGDHYVNALRPAIEAAGGILVDPVDARSMGETLAWYDGPHQSAENEPPETARETASVSESLVDEVLDALMDRDAALSPGQLVGRDRQTLRRPGLYTWWVDDEGAADLTAGLGHTVRPGLIYAGQTGATRWPSGLRSKATLEGRLRRNHARGSVRGSTFRHTLASVLSVVWGDWDEHRVSEWIERHLRVVPVPVYDADALGALEGAVLTDLDPPLNLDEVPDTPLRRALRELRRQLPRA